MYACALTASQNQLKKRPEDIGGRSMGTELTLTRSTLVNKPACSPEASSSVVASRRPGYTELVPIKAESDADTNNSNIAVQAEKLGIAKGMFARLKLSVELQQMTVKQ